MSENPKFEIKENTPEIEIKETNKAEIIQDIRDRYGILFISCQPRKVLDAMGFKKNDAEWFRDGLGLPEASDRIKIVAVADEEPLPDTVPENGVIIGGSAHSVYEDLPWMQRLKEFIRAITVQKKPLLGVCFGQQMIAESFGGKVEKGGKGREVGIVNINLTEEGEGDPLFEGVPSSFYSATSHGDVVAELPRIEQVAVLAYNAKYPYQALSIGDTTRAIQFHPEVDKERVEQTIKQRKGDLIKEGTIKEEDFDNFLADLKTKDIEGTRQRILRNFDKNFIVRFTVKP